MKRRDLDFRTIDEAIAEVDRLQKDGYEKGATWSLGQICNHAAIFVRGSMDGFTGPPPPWYIRLIAPIFVRRMLKTRKMPAGVKLPPHLLPPATVDETKEVEELKGLLRRFENWKQPLHKSTFGGYSDYETWKQMHLIHCAHHLGFLQPRAGA